MSSNYFIEVELDDGGKIIVRPDAITGIIEYPDCPVQLMVGTHIFYIKPKQVAFDVVRNHTMSAGVRTLK